MSLKHAILIPAVIASLGAAGIHFAVIQEHLSEYALFGYLFLALAWFQVIWPFAFFVRQSRPLAWLGIAINLGAVVVWVISRTTGLPIGPDPWKPESVGALDMAASALELFVVGCVFLLTAHRSREIAASVRIRSGVLVLALSSIAVIAITAVAFASQTATDAMP